ncbi:sodium:sulfate symporter [Fulvitalea axinellae]|uniref:Sodium:sulfate symporter n=1 Tax=Fulvitalea axinellae TaxID=1182444 RepID=A0AAU9D993_9BACT|nr:sodium:sulfate symporter [Fulvitalea axinellae]
MSSASIPVEITQFFGNYQPIIVAITLGLLFFSLFKEIIRPSLSFVCAVLTFMITGIINEREVTAGLSNGPIISVLFLIIITFGLKKNFNVEKTFNRAFDRGQSYHSFLFRMMSKVALLSSIINNTPVVALLTPYVYDWGRRNNISPSKLLIPLSYATIMGGMLTIIGTSTTMVMNGLMVEQGAPEINSYYLLIIGLMVLFTGLTFLTIFAGKLLPDHQDALEQFNENKREYLIETALKPNSKIIGKTVSEASLRNLKGVYLVEIIRKDRIISPVGPEEKIKSHDRLIFAGETSKVTELLEKEIGLTLPSYSQNFTDHISVLEAVVGNNSGLINSTPKEVSFRERYDAAVIAIHRHGQKLSGKIGNIPLQAGDLLLLYAGPNFYSKLDFYRDIHPLSKIREINRLGKPKSIGIAIVSAFFFAMAALGFVKLHIALLFIFTTMGFMKMISIEDMKNALDIDLAAILICSIAIGTAITNSGLGEIVAQATISALQPYGNISILLGLMLITTFLTSIVSNVGAVSIVFPIAYALSAKLGTDGMPLYMGIAFAASAAFLTPIGYQTNLIVYGPGGYRFKDFFKIGLPTTLIYLATAVLGILLLYGDSFLG